MLLIIVPYVLFKVGSKESKVAVLPVVLLSFYKPSHCSSSCLLADRSQVLFLRMRITLGRGLFYL